LLLQQWPFSSDYIFADARARYQWVWIIEETPSMQTTVFLLNICGTIRKWRTACYVYASMILCKIKKPAVLKERVPREVSHPDLHFAYP
jgi:hypothetical protein